MLLITVATAVTVAVATTLTVAAAMTIAVAMTVTVAVAVTVAVLQPIRSISVSFLLCQFSGTLLGFGVVCCCYCVCYQWSTTTTAAAAAAAVPQPTMINSKMQKTTGNCPQLTALSLQQFFVHCRLPTSQQLLLLLLLSLPCRG